MLAIYQREQSDDIMYNLVQVLPRNMICIHRPHWHLCVMKTYIPPLTILCILSGIRGLYFTKDEELHHTFTTLAELHSSLRPRNAGPLLSVALVTMTTRVDLGPCSEPCEDWNKRPFLDRLFSLMEGAGWICTESLFLDAKMLISQFAPKQPRGLLLRHHPSIHFVIR